jgi:N utilization substance protein B
MARVDRNILRIAVYEMVCVKGIPVRVVINEAVEVAKDFGTVDAPRFINGVLDHIAAMNVSSEANRGVTGRLVQQ